MVSVLPHVFSHLELGTKAVYLKKYKTIKKYESVSVLAGVGIAEGIKLEKNVINSKLKAYGSKLLFARTLGPILPFVSLPFYGFIYGSKFRKFAIATTEIGAQISKGEMGIVNWAWIGADVILFL